VRVWAYKAPVGAGFLKAHPVIDSLFGYGDADWPGLTAQGLAKLFQDLPPEVVPEYRTRRPYLSALLARHERDRDRGKPGSRPLFRRTQRGVYVLDSKLPLRIGEVFHPVYDLLFPSRTYGPRAVREFIEQLPTFFRPGNVP
jgi:hypothetical protein